MYDKKLNNAHTLYLCYFGLREPLVQTQVLPYLREIKKSQNIRVSLLTFEPNFKANWSDEQIAETRQELTAENISWHCLPYHKSPSVPATLYDVFAGARYVRHLVRKEKVNIIHARVHVPALMGALVKRIEGNKVKLIFDIRGFMPEEYTDAGRWKPNGKLYHSVKRVEGWLLKKADGFVVLTEKARDILFPESKTTGFDKFMRPAEVIPCCVDLEKFAVLNKNLRDEMRKKLNVQNRRVIVYAGSFGTWYMAHEMADFLAVSRENDVSTFALILTQSDPELMRSLLSKRGFHENDLLIAKVAPDKMPQYLNAADIALSFIKACYSKLSSSPTKIAEYLASGVPVVCNRGVGDIDAQIEIDNVGALIDQFDRKSYGRALQKIDELNKTSDLREKCRQSAQERFDLGKIGGARYRRLYDRLLNNQTQTKTNTM